MRDVTALPLPPQPSYEGEAVELLVRSSVIMTDAGAEPMPSHRNDMTFH